VTIIISSSGREAAMFAALCDQKSWPCHACTSIAEFTKIIEKLTPRTVITRYRLEDGHSDEILSLLSSNGQFATTRVIVLLPANVTTQQEVRQVGLGADCLMRDPLRMEVLLAHVERNRERLGRTPTSTSIPETIFEIAGVMVHTNKHILERSGRTFEVAPQVVAFLRLLARSAENVLTYPVIYNELFNRRFTGDTANARVLLAKAANSFALLDVNLRAHVSVIAKSGYLYRSAAAQISSATAKSRAKGAVG
jgi:DNA-binding response OmpR family regulator